MLFCFVTATPGILTSQFYCALWCHRTEWWSEWTWGQSSLLPLLRHDGGTSV